MYTENSLEILIATMNRNSLAFLDKMFPDVHFSNFNILIVNQTTPQNILKSNYEKVKVFNVFEIGLSKSRNLALKESSRELLLISDDDVVFKPNFSEVIQTAFNEYPRIDIFRFRFKGKVMKKYAKKVKLKLNIFEVLNTNSIELVLKRKNIQSNLQFNEDFGLGAKFGLGEEAIFVSEAKSKGCSIGFYPKTIVSHLSYTTSKKLNLMKSYFNLGAVYYKIFGKKYLLWVLIKVFFDLKHGKITLSKVNTVIKKAKRGKQEYVSKI